MSTPRLSTECRDGEYADHDGCEKIDAPPHHVLCECPCHPKLTRSERYKLRQMIDQWQGV